MDWSEGMYRLLGVEPNGAEPSIALVQSRLHPEDLRRAGEIEGLLSRSGSFEQEFRICQHGGRVRYVRNRGEILLDCAGKPLKAVGILVEVPRPNERELREEIERLRTLIASVSASLLVNSAIRSPTDRPLERADAERLVSEAEDCFRYARKAGLKNEIATGLEVAGYELMARAVEIDTSLERTRRER